MVLAFETASLREICEKTSSAERDFGTEVAEKLKKRLADLSAAFNMNDLEFVEPTFFGEIYDCVLVNIGNSHKLILQANHTKNPMIDGKIDWSKVNRIKVMGIEAYNV